VLYADPDGRTAEEGFWLDGLDYLQAHGLDAEIIVRSLEPAESILEVVADRDADCVVLGPYSSNAIRDFLFGGTSKELLERGNVPLLFGF
jgi:nucleotide-binding universal stress UspA family protein